MDKKPKVVNYALIPESDGSEPYRLLDEVRTQWHKETFFAKIALAWRIHTNADVDGHLVLGKCIRVTDLNKEFSHYDFVIVLNQEVWSDSRFTRANKMALLDHEMCHAAVAFDSEGEPIYDERSRPVYRSRKHDIEEFRDVVSRHGCYKTDLERFAEALLEKHANPLFDQQMAEADNRPTALETAAFSSDTNPPADPKPTAKAKRRVN